MRRVALPPTRLASHADLRHALYPANHSRTFFCWRGYVADSESSFAYLDARNLPDEYTGDCATAARSHELQGFIESPPQAINAPPETQKQ